MIFTSACDGSSRTEFWAFDKFGTKIWNTTVSFGNNRGLVAINGMGDFTWVFEKSRKYRRFHSSYRAGPGFMEDGIPYPMLISATQEFETTDLDIVYKVTDMDDANVTTGLLAYIDGDDSFENIIIPKTFIGDVTGKIGQNVDVNVTHSLSWDMPQDWNASVGTVAIEVFAKDERDLLDLHFVEIPGDENNATRLPSTVFLLKMKIFLQHVVTCWLQDPEIKHGKGSGHGQRCQFHSISPDSLSGLALWLDASDINGDGLPNSENNGTQIAIWKDKSLNDFNATQDNPDNQPIYVADDGNGKPALGFTNHWLDLNGVDLHAKEIILAASFSEQMGRAIIASLDGVVIEGRFESENDLKLQKSYLDFAGPENVQHAYKNSTASLYFPLNQATVVKAILGDGSAYGGHFQNMMIGRDTHDNNRWNGYIYEILVFEERLLPWQYLAIEWYLGQKWGVYGPVHGLTAFGVNKQVTDWGKNYLLDKMNLRAANSTEISRAKRGTTQGTTNQFSPDFRIQTE